MTHTTVPITVPVTMSVTPVVHAKLAAIEAELASIRATLDGMLADAEQWDARAAERAATIRPAVNAAMDSVTVARPRVWPVALVVPLVLLVAVPLVLVLSGCQDSGARPTPAPGPAVTAPTWQAHVAAELTCANGGGSFSGRYAWKQGERVPVCNVPDGVAQ